MRLRAKRPRASLMVFDSTLLGVLIIISMSCEKWTQYEVEVMREHPKTNTNGTKAKNEQTSKQTNNRNKNKQPNKQTNEKTNKPNKSLGEIAMKIM